MPRPRRLLTRGVVAAVLLSFAAGAEPAVPNDWALKPVVRPAVPAIANRQSAGGNPIDAFLLARLREEGLLFAPPADRRTLIRRATFDLHGLPPTPAEVEAFVNDPAPDAYERLIDRLLASPHYGERWGRHWLDVVRFAESQGFERDKPRDHAWRYRDYVIRSFNDDKPYDRFVREQLAGDLLWKDEGRRMKDENRSRISSDSSFILLPSSLDSVIATGLLVAGPYDEAGTSSASKLVRLRVREEELEDLVGTVGQAFLGLTVNCARCHDHKFDPIPQRDYYRVKSVFDAVRHGDRPLLTAEEQHRRAEELALLGREIAAREKELAALADAGRTRLAPPPPAALPADVPAPVSRWTFDTDLRDALGGLHGAARNGAKVKGGRLVLDGRRAFVETEPLPQDLTEKTLEAWVVLPERAQRGGAVMSVLIDGGRVFDAIVYGEREPGRWIAGSEFFRRTRDLNAAEESAGPQEMIHLAVTFARDGRIALYRNGQPYGEPYRPERPEASPVTYPAGKSTIYFGLRHRGAANGFLAAEIEEARLYDRALTPRQVERSFRTGVASIQPADVRNALSGNERTRWDELQRELDEFRRRRDQARLVPLAYAVNIKPAEPTVVFLRGDVEKTGETVSAGGLSAVSVPAADFGLPPDAPEAERRLRFAAWVTDPANPLTARVMVNRLWQHHFGRGLVETPNDFGANGARPSHPELLDWLASEFILSGGRQPPGRETRGLTPPAQEGAWSIKRMHRLMMTSAAYRQSSRYDAKAAALDADNRLLWRFAPRRVEAEVMRDAMLAVSGRLNSALGGPSFRPFTVTVFNSTFYDLVDDGRPEFNRRTVYRMGVNSAKDPLLESFDCPEPSVKTPRRSVTTTPIQALGLMNNPFVQRQARSMAQRIESESSDRVGRAYLLAFGRMPSAAERDRAERHVREHGLASLCWVLLNSSEFLYVK